MNANEPIKSDSGSRQSHRRGFTLIEVAISIAVVMALVLAGLGARYLTVKQAVRADAYNVAGRLAILLLEGWRSNGLTSYDPANSSLSALSGLSPTVTISKGVPGSPAAPTGFTTLDTYRVTADNKNFYIRLAYKAEDLTPGAEHPPMMHVVVAFLDGYRAGDAKDSMNRVSMTTYR